MTKPNYGVEIISYRFLSVYPELLQRFQQEKKDAEHIQNEALCRPFEISSSQKDDTNLLGFGGTLA